MSSPAPCADGGAAAVPSSAPPCDTDVDTDPVTAAETNAVDAITQLRGEAFDAEAAGSRPPAPPPPSPVTLPCVTEALKTALKLLDNVLGRPGDLRTRSIRAGNPAFHSKLGCFAGGVGILKAAGFTDILDAGVPHLHLSPADECRPRLLAY